MRKRILQIVFVLFLTGIGFYVLVKAQVIKAPFFFQAKEEVEKIEAEEEDFPDFDSITGVLTKDLPLKELKKIAEAYTKPKSLRFSSKIYALKNNQSKPVEETSMLYEKSGALQYYKVGGIEYLLNEDAFLLVNHDIKVMSLTTGVKAMPQDQLSQLKHIEEYLRIDSSEAFVSSVGDFKYITINNLKHPQVQQYVIKYSSVTFLVEEIRIYMAIVQEEERTEEMIRQEKLKAATAGEKAQDADTSSPVTLSDLGLEQAVYRVVIRYSDYKNNFDFSDEHRIKHFIMYADGEILPAKGFETYELNN